MDEFPKPLVEAVDKYLADHESAKLLTTRTCVQLAGSPKKYTNYRAYLEWGNLMVVLSYSEVIGLVERHMVVGDMQVFMEESTWFK